MRNLQFSLENCLSEVEMHYVMRTGELNGNLLQLESEQAQHRAKGQHQAQEYEALLNKVKLEAKITTNQCLLEEVENFNLGDSLGNSNSIQFHPKNHHPQDCGRQSGV